MDPMPTLDELRRLALGGPAPARAPRLLPEPHNWISADNINKYAQAVYDAENTQSGFVEFQDPPRRVPSPGSFPPLSTAAPENKPLTKSPPPAAQSNASPYTLPIAQPVAAPSPSECPSTCPPPEEAFGR